MSDTNPNEAAHTQRRMRAVQEALDAAATPGAAVAILVDGQPDLVAANGFADLARTQPLAADAQWYVYSVTKSMIATLILQMAEQDAVALDAPVQAYLPAELPPVPSVTLRQLLNHTGGLPDYGGLPAYAAAIQADPTTPWTDALFLSKTLAQGRRFAPGAGWAYSNIGFLLLRRVIEAVSGQTLRAVVAERLVAPLGLQQTQVAETLADAQSLTPGFSSFLSVGGPLADVRTTYHPGWVAHGVARATAHELALIVDAIAATHLVNKVSLAAMLESVPVPVQHPLFQQPGYGLGLMIDRAGRYGPLFGHGGGGPGYSIGALHMPNANGRRITTVALANRDQPDLGLRMAFELAMLTAN